MKKGTKGIYMACFLCCAILLVSGCDKLGGGRPEKVNGTVISVDEAKKEVVIKDASTGKQRTLTTENPGQLAMLKPGTDIKAKVKPGTNVAEKITERVKKDSGKAGGQKDGEE